MRQIGSQNSTLSRPEAEMERYVKQNAARFDRLLVAKGAIAGQMRGVAA